MPETNRKAAANTQKVGDAMVDGLKDYGRQTISSLAQRDYDLGKFLFTASTFAILLSFTLVTALGKIYFLTLVSTFWFGKSVKIALSLVTDGAGDLNPDSELLVDYEQMRLHIAKRVNSWYKQFNFGLIIFIVAFAITSIFLIADSYLNLGITEKMISQNQESELRILIDNIYSLMADLENRLTVPDGD
ncbi:hypothetical protein CGK41_22070 [Vibrio parahaemolyticus]|uniref:hypothetical protein n=2 Tax=Vibrio parahaemolyticus TaxID=670 RepID=UPI00112362F9|nr:hypothetical protein [Vibrio parahaemolyticus]EGR3366105.1 hypothetical protein [Vibrio parahaemolyticus]TNZ68997.1 hypothetical protein CGK41_22070 [Vibrio parahaemolyticus]